MGVASVPIKATLPYIFDPSASERQYILDLHNWLDTNKPVKIEIDLKSKTSVVENIELNLVIEFHFTNSIYSKSYSKKAIINYNINDKIYTLSWSIICNTHGSDFTVFKVVNTNMSKIELNDSLLVIGHSW